MGIVSDIFSRSDDERRRALEEHEAAEAERQREVVAAAAAERDANDRQAVLALAPVLLAEVVGLHSPHAGVSLDALRERLGLRAGDPAARGLSILLGRESDEQRTGEERGALEEVQQVGAWQGLRWRRRDGALRFDAHAPDHPRRATPFAADSVAGNTAAMRTIEDLRLRVRMLEAQRDEALRAVAQPPAPAQPPDQPPDQPSAQDQRPES